MQQSDLGNIWYMLFDRLGFERWVAESITILLAFLSIIIIWYWCIKGIFIVKVEKPHSKTENPMEKERKLRG